MFSARFLRSLTKIESPHEARRFLRLDRYWCPEIVQPLLLRADELTATKPTVARDLAQIALELVQRMRGASRALHAEAHYTLGAAHRGSGELSKAETHLRAAAKLAAQGSIDLIGKIVRQKALLLADQECYDESLKLLQGFAEAERKGGRLPSQTLICTAEILLRTGDAAGVFPYCAEVLDGEDPASPTFSSAMQYLVTALAAHPLLVGEVVEARKLLRRVQERIRGIRETPVRYAVWQTEALLHTVLEEYREAIFHLRSARTGFLRLDQHPAYAHVSLDLASVHAKRNENAVVHRVLAQTACDLLASDIPTTKPSPTLQLQQAALFHYWCPEIAEPLLGAVDGMVSLKPKAALDLAHVALALVHRNVAASKTVHAHALCSLAVAQRFLEKLVEAETNFSAAEELAANGPFALVAMIARHKALLLSGKNDHQAAIQLVRRAIALEREAGIQPNRSLVCAAIVLHTVGDAVAATDCTSEVLETESPDSPIYTSALYNHAVSLVMHPQSADQVLEAQGLLRRVNERMQGIRQSPALDALSHSIAIVHHLVGEYDEAIALLERACAGFLRMELLASYASASIDLAAVYVKKQDDEAAMLVISRTLLKLTEAGADEQTIERFRVAEGAGSAGEAVERLRST